MELQEQEILKHLNITPNLWRVLQRLIEDIEMLKKKNQELIDLNRKNHVFSAQLNDYLVTLIIALSESNYIDNKAIDKKFRDLVDRTYNIKGRIYKTKYNFDEDIEVKAG